MSSASVNLPKVYPEGQTWIYVIVRKDIPVEQQIVQVAHACAESGAVYNLEYLKRKDYSNLVLLEVSGELELFRAYNKMYAAGVKGVRFYEPDYGIAGYTALCSEPITIEDRGAFSGYSLWNTPKPWYTRLVKWFTPK